MCFIFRKNDKAVLLVLYLRTYLINAFLVKLKFLIFQLRVYGCRLLVFNTAHPTRYGTVNLIVFVDKRRLGNCLISVYAAPSRFGNITFHYNLT